jgi:nitrile hydratase
MSRINDVGGMHGFGAIDVSDDGQPFHNEWEARVLGINRLLLAAGIYNLDEFRDLLRTLVRRHRADPDREGPAR